MEQESLFWSRDIERPLGKRGKEIALRQCLIGLGIVQFEWPVRGQNQHRCASERGFHHGRQIIGRRRARSANQTGQYTTLCRALSPEGGAAFVVEQFRHYRRLLFQRQNEWYGARA